METNTATATTDNPQKPKKKGKISNRVITIILIVILVVGLGVLLYPTIANWWNERTMSRAVATYNEAVDNLSEEDYEAILAAAEAYNEEIYRIGSATTLVNPERVKGYEDLLDVAGTGVMGYITIDRISVELPIYHGTSDSVLAAGAGHLEGSSLPIGGENTHSVISAHRGLPSAKLFTDLDSMEVGDIFTITVLNELYTYQVDQINIIEPTEFEYLYIEPGQDYCTLMTCTPYGINTHRLLVRGTRIENLSNIQVNPEADKVNTLLVAVFIAIPLLIILFVWLMVSTRRIKSKPTK